MKYEVTYTISPCATVEVDAKNYDDAVEKFFEVMYDCRGRYDCDDIKIVDVQKGGDIL